MDRFTRFDPSSTGPDIMAWCEWEYYQLFGDRERLEKVFPPLMAYHRWMAEFRTWPDGTYFSSGWGCGMDNIPRQMPGYSVMFSHGHMVWADTCMQELNTAGILLKMSEILGKNEYMSELKAECENLSKVINDKLWDEETGFYYDLWKNGELNFVQHIGAYWSLLAEIAPKDRAERMIKHLEDENIFKTEIPVPALAKTHPAFEKEGNYWCGGVWAPTNYMLLKGLDKYGKHTLAHEIGKAYVDCVAEVFDETGTVFENYAPYRKDGKASKGKIAKKDFVGWTGLAPISILFEYVFGIKPDAPNEKIVWHIDLTERHGVKKYPFGRKGEITLICEARSSKEEKPQVTVKADFPVTVEVIWGEKENKQSFIAGE